VIDMHLHSNWSDGGDTPFELARQAQAAGLDGAALTDHDTLSGLPEWEEAGGALGFPTYGGIEISCREPETGRPMHLLGYGIPPSGRALVEDFCAPVRQSRDEAVRESARRLQKAGYPVDVSPVEALAGPGGALFKQFIMRLLVEAGLCDGLYAPLYQTLFKTGENGRPPIASLSFQAADPFEAIQCVRLAGGVTALAHPAQYDNFHLLPELKEAGLWGIEAHHPAHNPEAAARCLMLADWYGLEITGGSDAHGCYGEGERVGQCGVDSCAVCVENPLRVFSTRGKESARA
jgi:predicted metal-dependent phosphoesterase TrpH